MKRLTKQKIKKIISEFRMEENDKNSPMSFSDAPDIPRENCESCGIKSRTEVLGELL